MRTALKVFALLALGVMAFLLLAVVVNLVFGA